MNPKELNLSLNELETKRYYAWTNRHYKACKPKGGWVVKFTLTGLGNGIDVICPKCKKAKDLTDYSCW